MATRSRVCWCLACPPDPTKWDAKARLTATYGARVYSACGHVEQGSVMHSPPGLSLLVDDETFCLRDDRLR